MMTDQLQKLTGLANLQEANEHVEAVNASLGSALFGDEEEEEESEGDDLQDRFSNLRRLMGTFQTIL